MELSLRQKIGQLALCSLDGRDVTAPEKEFLREYRVGNIIHFGNNVLGFAQARAFNEKLDALIRENCAGVPPLVGIDHEGGRVMRFGEDFTWFPSQMALGAADDPALTEAVGAAMGRELRAAGFQISFSPVVDVNSNPQNPVIGVRAFGDDPENVARHGEALARGLQSEGVMACLKHFPGHGDTAVDSHYGLPRVDKPLAALEQAELNPYRALIARRAADAVMTTHILFPALEPENVPATLSQKILTGLLREKMGFSGLIVTDGMQMRAIAEHYGVERGCVEALKAGCDLICVGTGGPGVLEKQKSCLDALYQAALSGEIPAARIDEALRYVLAAKEKYCTAQSEKMPDFAAHARLNAQACREAVTTLTPARGALSGRVLCASAPVREVAFGLTHGDPRSLSFAKMAAETLQAPFVLLSGAPLPEPYDTLLIGASSLTPECHELVAAREALEQGKRVAFVLTGAPYAATLLPAACSAVCVYCLTPQAVRAALDALTGKEKAHGTLPVRKTP